MDIIDIEDFMEATTMVQDIMEDVYVVAVHIAVVQVAVLVVVLVLVQEVEEQDVLKRIFMEQT